MEKTPEKSPIDELAMIKEGPEKDLDAHIEEIESQAEEEKVAEEADGALCDQSETPAAPCVTPLVVMASELEEEVDAGRERRREGNSKSQIVPSVSSQRLQQRLRWLLLWSWSRNP